MLNNCNHNDKMCFPSNCFIIGPTGPTGPQGSGSATIEVGTVTTGEPGSQASVTNVGTDENVILDFVIPQGVTGPTGPRGNAPTFGIGTVETGLPGSEAQVTIQET